MSNVDTVKAMYAAFGRGDVPGILSHMTEDVSWEFEATPEISWGGIRKGPKEAVGFFEGIAAEHGDPKLDMTTFLESGNNVAAFGRYDATIKTTGVRVSTPVAHLFQFRDGKVARYVNIINTAAFVAAMKK